MTREMPTSNEEERMTSNRRFFSGDSLPQALNQAAQHFQVPPSEIRYQQVEKRHGFLKVRRKVVIEVDADNPFVAAPADEDPERQESGAPEAAGASAPAPVGADEARPSSEPPEPPERPAPPAREPQAATPPIEKKPAAAPEGGVSLPEAPPPASERYPAAEGEEAAAAADALSRILALAGLELEHEILQGEEELLVELWGDDQEILLRDRGRLLLAIQHLMPRVIRGLIGRSVVCKVDSDDFHMIREERLRDLAQRAADEVRDRGRSKTLEPMSPDERRIVHLTLADYPGVETESHGSGLFKRVMVRQSGGGNYKR